MEPTQQNAFMMFLSEIRKGALVTEATEKMANVIASIKDTGKPGELVVKIKFSPSPNGETILVADDVKIKRPERAKKLTTFFPTEENFLTRTNPEQPELTLNIVDGGKADVQQPKAAAK